MGYKLLKKESVSEVDVENIIFFHENYIKVCENNEP